MSVLEKYNGNSNEKEIIEYVDIGDSGSLVKDIENVDVLTKKIPNIEVKEFEIEGTGNFLDIKENVINIPLEMIIFPFFTPQKQNKKVNFTYKFTDLGVTMHCTLVAKNIDDEVYQPSILEEKIFTFLIAMYEQKKNENDTDEYIEFEITDFIVDFLGNKMNRVYYSKIEQALKNLKSTEYQFVIESHKKLGNYQFEDEEFKLLTYQKLKTGKKVYYRVNLNKNIRNKLKEKRYIIFNSKALLEIITEDPIASRIYKYISKIRYSSVESSINIKTLAAIIPLKIIQTTERSTKDGEIKVYRLNRIKQVLQRIEKAYNVLVRLGYIEYFESVYNIEEDTFYINYKFNIEKDGECHQSSFIKNKKKFALENKNIKKITNYSSKNEIFSEKILKTIKKARANKLVEKYWDTKVENKIKKIVENNGEEQAIKVITAMGNINYEVKSLIKYINRILKNIKNENNNLTLFSHLSNKNSKNETMEIKGNKNIVNTKGVFFNEDKVQNEIEIFINKISNEEVEIIENKARKMLIEDKNINEDYLNIVKTKSYKIYKEMLKPYLYELVKLENKLGEE